MGLEYGEGAQIYFTSENEESVGTISVNGNSVPSAGAVANKFDIFHPIIYIGHDDEMLRDAVILCCKNMATAKSLFPEFYHLDEELMETLIFGDMTEQERYNWERILYQSYGKYIEFLPAREFAKVRTESETKYCVFELVYVVVAIIFMIELLLGNMKRLIERKQKEYMVHYLYGESLQMIQRRAGGVILLLHIIPFMGIIYKFRENMEYYNQYKYYLISPDKSVGFLAVVIAGVVVLYGYICWYSGRQMKKECGIGSLRRKNGNFIGKRNPEVFWRQWKED